MMFDDTIAAISTPPGSGAIAVVRISGKEAFRIAEEIFSAKNLQSHVAHHGYIKDPTSGEKIDEVIVIPYKAPRTYTGEDLVEINCHGGSLITSELLALCLRQGARIARPGEFTQRAFLSGRIDLTQAEAVLDLIQAKTGRQGRSALSTLSGQLGEQIKAIRAQLMSSMSAVVAGIDFPEEVGEASPDDIAVVVNHSLKSLRELSATARTGRFLRDGLRLAIVGRPNAGKSSLLNQMLRFDRAIVTEIPGTTRDSLEELLDLNGIPIILIDTAGVRSTEDKVEKIGIERTQAVIEQADLILLMMDVTEGWSDPEEEILSMIEPRPYIFVANKIDLEANAGVMAHSNNSFAQVAISAKNGIGMNELTKAIENWVFADRSDHDHYVSLNARQSALCATAVEALEHVQATLDSGLPQDCLATDLKIAIDSLSEICGEAVSEEIIHQVFANFCIGK